MEMKLESVTLTANTIAKNTLIATNSKRKTLNLVANMTLRTFTDKNGNEWSWEETPEVIKALKEVHKDYDGPLYAPHPDLKNGKETD